MPDFKPDVLLTIDSRQQKHMSSGRFAENNKFSLNWLHVSFGIMLFLGLLFLADYNLSSKELYLYARNAKKVRKVSIHRHMIKVTTSIRHSLLTSRNTFGSRTTIKMRKALREKLPKHAKECISFFSHLQKAIISQIGQSNYCSRTNLTLIGAYAYPDYSVVTIEPCQWYGQKVYCHYFDADWKKLGSSVESVVFPEFAVHCCRHPRAVYMGITEREDQIVNFAVPVLDRTEDKPKYNLSVCLAPIYGNESKWLMLAELIEHYKLQGVQHFYLYVADIDDYSLLLIDDYEKTGEVEVVYFTEEQDRKGRDWQLTGTEDCLQRSRHHSRYVIFADLDERILALGNQTLGEYIPEAMTESNNTGMLRFRQTWVLRPRKPPEKYEGEATLKKHLPTLVFHNTSAVGPSGHTAKCVLDPRRVIIMWVHDVFLYFPGYEMVEALPEEAIIRHYRDLIDDNWGSTWLYEVETFGNFTMTDYPPHLMAELYKNVKERLSRVYKKI